MEMSAWVRVTAEELMRKDMVTWDRLGVHSASSSDSTQRTIETEYDLYYTMTIEMLAEYELKKLSKPILRELQEYLENENFHSLNRVIDKRSIWNKR